MGDASGLGFVSFMWSQTRLVLESGGFNPLYQGRSSNFREGEDLTESIWRSVEQGDLKNVEICFFDEI